jgi:O-antigen biosynthesis protein WbqP
MKRLIDIVGSILAIVILLLPMVIIAIFVKISSEGPVLYWSTRTAGGGGGFKMAKFRTMKKDAPVVASHLIKDPSKYITSLGSFLRRTSLDELPQLWNILRGDMSFVGPRPALFNEMDLIALRKERGIDKLTPGLTGLAQINGRDELSYVEKAKFDFEYLQKKSLKFDLKILCLTVIKVIKSAGISH